MIIFDGIGASRELEQQISAQILAMQKQGLTLPHIASVVFREDSGGQLYTKLKTEAAKRVGIEYSKYEYSLTDDKNGIIEQIKKLNDDPKITAILIQKPRRQVFVQATGLPTNEFDVWWHLLVSAIDPTKDVDCLTPHNLSQISIRPDLDNQTNNDSGPLLPATAQAVWLILQDAAHWLNRPLNKEKIGFIGLSQLMALPLADFLKRNGIDSHLIKHQEFTTRLESGTGLKDLSCVIAATGQPGLVKGEQLAENVILVDVGEPRGDIDLASLNHTAAFYTPVPGGVGPLTIACLLQNAVKLCYTTGLRNK